MASYEWMQQHVAFAWFFIFIFYLLFSGSTITWGQPNARLAVIGDFGTDTEREADVARLVHNWQVGEPRHTCMQQQPA